jgi:hypothetical protein
MDMQSFRTICYILPSSHYILQRVINLHLLSLQWLRLYIVLVKYIFDLVGWLELILNLNSKLGTAL